eukprot:10694094-Ditylum_brightwellii.AAC.1
MEEANHQKRLCLEEEGNIHTCQSNLCKCDQSRASQDYRSDMGGVILGKPKKLTSAMTGFQLGNLVDILQMQMEDVSGTTPQAMSPLGEMVPQMDYIQKIRGHKSVSTSSGQWRWAWMIMA